MTDQRPDPDRLLAALERESEQAARGRLKIFFGACAGVGKTYAMLNAARQKLAEGADVLIGVVETHGRSETAALLEGLPLLPRREVAYRGRTLAEFDLDAALGRKPSLIVVDELAHTNIEGSRHRKRWQDVEELLAAGIDVWTALNVQHLESLNDVVGSITGIRVHETVPDQVYERADEVSLIDLPPEELQSRLKAGKVYLGDAAERAADNFFRTGNLIALRELALRRTADRVDAQMRAYRADRAIDRVWQTRDRLIVCIGPGTGGETLVRNAARMASHTQAEWIAVSVETPDMAGESESHRGRRRNALKLAASLGAEVCSLSAVNAADALVRFAINRNAGKLVLGRARRGVWQRLLHPSLLDRLALLEHELEIVVVGLPHHENRKEAPERRLPVNWRGYVWAIVICATTTAFAALLLSVFDLANVVMVFLLAVVGVALRFGRGPGALAACLSVASFDFFFVPPRLTFTVNDTQYVFTFLLMLVVALVIGQLAAKLKFEAVMAAEREHRSAQLAELSRALSAALSTEQIVDVALQNLAGIFQARVSILLPDAEAKVRPAHAPDSDFVDLAVAQWVFEHEQEAGRGTATLPAAKARYLPLRAPMRVRGVLGLLPGHGLVLDEPAITRQLETCISQIAQALERVHYVEVAQEALVSMESERLRNSLLAAVSHDLRTPLTGLVGMADTLAARPSRPPEEQEMIQGMRDTAHRLTALVSNLLDMARLQTGRIEVKRDWCAIEEVIETASRQLSVQLASHQLETRIEPDLPLCEFDPVLIERVLVNLLDNAIKYTPAASHIRISAELAGRMLQVSVDDDGPGLPTGPTERLFAKFERGDTESAQPGVGLGLAICRAIVSAHGGHIEAHNRANGGASFSFSLPLGEPPEAANLEKDA
ncbi:sensor histidine kinase KdpD [Uliginosibacterium sp. TH139]|uniref:sensor histidine kinase n=1 Tax=Uliginosibacterium sp. TH139 TaxID=2067453 RepID=UPI000C7D0AA0|nr:sensor histidine kinase KdpD [Uliginosibacterium sp. TH139]PLK47478.1 two-component system sensor histidine kinase KdbD [Uliginosibacterium sp. TH139]